MEIGLYERVDFDAICEREACFEFGVIIDQLCSQRDQQAILLPFVHQHSTALFTLPLPLFTH